MSVVVEKVKAIFRELRRRRVIRVAIAYLAATFVLLQVGELLFPALRLPDWSMTFLVAIAILCFPIAIILAWAFQLTPAGVVVDTGNLAEPAVADLAGQEAPAPELVTAARTEDRADPARMSPKSIVVLPFANMSGDPDNEYFSDGIMEELIAALTKIADLRVVSRTSAMVYKNADRTIQGIAVDLKVGSVVEGSVRRSESRVRIRARLVDARTDHHVWAETYDRELDDIFEIQSDVAQRIARALEARLTDKERAELDRKPTESVEAYDLFLRARQAWNLRTEQGLEDSVAFLKQALREDPEYAQAYGALADSYATLGLYNAREPATVMPRALEAAERALDLDPSLGSALSARGLVRSVYEWRWAEAEDDFREALTLSPRHPTSHQWYAMQVLAPLGRFAEAREALGRARALDPASPAIRASQVFVDYLSGDFKSAVDESEALLRDWPSFAMGHYFLGQALQGQECHDEAIAALERANELRGGSAETVAAIGHAAAVAGNVQYAQARRDQLDELAERTYVSPARLALIDLALGHTDQAIAHLDRAVEVRAADLIWLGTFPAFAPLRADPRFQRVLEAVGVNLIS